MPPSSGSISDRESHRRMVDELDAIRRRAPKENMYVGDGLVRQLRAQLAALADDTKPAQRWVRTYQLAKMELTLGREQEAIELFTRCHALLPELVEVRDEIVLQFHLDIAVAYLRLAETQNCCQQNTPESCIFPIQGAGIHTDPSASRQAISHLSDLLAKTHPNESLHLAARWLLNVAYMTIGEHPANVPRQYLIAPDSFLPDADFLRLDNVAAAAGVATFSLAGGAVADDLDGDGYLDLVVSTFNPGGQLRIFWNNRNGGFTDGTKAAGVTGILGGLNLIQTDYNNDGNLDIFVMRGGWLSSGGRHPNSLLRNNGDRTFTDVTVAAGLALVNLPTQTGAWADYDLDGDLDLYVGNETTPEIQSPCQLFRNNGDGTFVDVASEAGVTNGRLTKAVVWGDFDADRFPDLYVSNYGGKNRLYRNAGNGRFEDVAKQLGVADPVYSFPSWFWDADNDGVLDLLVSSYSGGIAEVAAYFSDSSFDKRSTLPKLYRGDGSGGFQDVSDQWNLRRPIHPMGANFGDLDNDGFLDAYFGTGWPEYHELMPNVLYWNQDGKRLLDVTTAAGVGHLQKGHAVAFADFDNDGDQDLFEQMGGFAFGDRYYDALYANPGTDHHWIKVKLIGVDENRAAIGARIHIRIIENGNARSIYRHVCSGGSFGGNPLRQEIGLGHADSIEVLEVFWPRSGETQAVQNVPMDRLVEISEGSDRFRDVPLEPKKLGI